MKNNLNTSCILLADYNQSLNLAAELEAIGWETDCLVDSKALFSKLLANDIELLIVDIDLESEGLFSVERYLLMQPNLSIITVGKDINCSVELLKAGVDRFIPAPFTNAVMTENVKAMARVKQHAAVQITEVETVWKLIGEGWILIAPNHKTLNLTAREFRFLEILFLNQGKVVSKQELIKAVIGRNYDTSHHRLNLMIARLRKKVHTLLDIELPIKTEYTVGYSFASPTLIE